MAEMRAANKKVYGMLAVAARKLGVGYAVRGEGSICQMIPESKLGEVRLGAEKLGKANQEAGKIGEARRAMRLAKGEVKQAREDAAAAPAAPAPPVPTNGVEVPKGHGMKSQVMTVDVTTAMKWLEQLSGKQRSVADKTVAKYAQDMRDGKWRLTGQPIIFDRENRLIDGQHRLWAVVESQATVQFLVVSGIDPEAIHSIDVGRPRSTATVLGLLGMTNSNRTVAVCKQVDFAVSGEDRSLSVDQVQEMIESYPGIAWVMSQHDVTKGSVLNVAPVLAAFALAFERAPKVVAEMWESFRTGADLPKNDPLLTMRNTLTGPNGKLLTQGTTGRRGLVRRMLTALAYKQQGKTLSKSYDSSEGVKFYLGTKAAQRSEKTLALPTEPPPSLGA